MTDTAFKAGSATIGGGLTLSSVMSPTALSGTRKDNYAPVDAVDSTLTLPRCHKVSQGASAATDIGGFSATGLAAGFEFDFHNISAFDMRLLQQDSNSTSGNRMTMPTSATWTLKPGCCARIGYTGSGFRPLFMTTTDFPSLSIGGNTVFTNAYANTTHYEWKTEHLATPQITNVMDGIFNTAFAGGGSAGFTAVANPGRHGVVSANTGTTAAGRASYNTSASLAMGAATVVTFECAFGVPTLDDGVDKFAVWAGLISTPVTVDQTAGAYVLYDHNNVATSGPNGGNADKLSAWTVSGSVRTAVLLDGTGGTVNTPVGADSWPSTNILHVKIIFTVGTSVAFYVNDTLRYTSTTNLPSTTGLAAGWSILKSAGANSRSVEVDFTGLAIDMPVRASP
jgi:hypothetical protein